MLVGTRLVFLSFSHFFIFKCLLFVDDSFGVQTQKLCNTHNLKILNYRSSYQEEYRVLIK